MGFWNKYQPLGIPEGSVRAILALSVIAFSFWYFYEFKQIPKELVGMDTFVITYYFTKRDNKKDREQYWKLRFKINPQSPLRESIYIGKDIGESINKLKQDYQNDPNATNIVIEHYERLN